MATSSRRYRSPRREQSAAQTRQDILETASALFLANGYARVTVADIAREAGIAVKTVYASVGTKSDLLRELITADLAHSSSVATIAAVRAAPDLETAIGLIAHGTRVDKERFASSLDLLEASKTSDEGAKQTWDEMVAAYRGALRDLAEDLVTRGLATGDVDSAADCLWFCFGLSAWRVLVTESGWSYDDAERLLTRHAILMLSEARPRG